jgi:hypothetical protein
VRSNCILYALTAWLKPAPAGEESYLVIRRSRVRCGLLHFLHGVLDPATNQIEVTSYRPQKGHVKTNFAPCFDGEVQRGDMP